MPRACFDYAGADLAVVDGDCVIGAGLRLIPTPGHSPGHQGLLVETAEGRELLGGQSFDSAYEFGLADLAARLAGGPDALEDVEYPEWMHTIQGLDLQRVRFAHDLAEWRPPPFDLPRSEPSLLIDPY